MHKGKVHKYGADINTDVIIPARYLNVSQPEELARHCMEDLDRDFITRVKPGDIVITSPYTFTASAEVIRYLGADPVFVDINPHKQGTYIAGTGQEIVAPEFLRGYHPHVVIVMNPIYRQEIEQDLRRIGLAAEVITV